ncbi:MAG: hypothetical protein U1F47_13795 [Hyphomicrobiales bacterium]
MMRTLGLSLALTLGLLFTPSFAPPAAKAVTININVGNSISSGRGITCSEGQRRLRNRGFRDVRRIDCRGRIFVYRAWRGGNRYEISLRSRDGRVTNVRRIRR